MAKKHGHTTKTSQSRTYSSWCDMKQRCLNPNNSRYSSYGGRGISICERWKTFENFLADMGECPVEKQLDRIDNNGDYELANCRWASRLEQQNNLRSNRPITAMGQTLNIAQWARKLEVHSSSIITRLGNGWTDEQAVTVPFVRRNWTRIPENISCLRCGYKWLSKVVKPKACPNCRSYRWFTTEDKRKTRVSCITPVAVK